MISAGTNHAALSDAEKAAEDDAAFEGRHVQAMITVPDELLPAIRPLLASHRGTGASATEGN